MVQGCEAAVMTRICLRCGHSEAAEARHVMIADESTECPRCGRWTFMLSTQRARDALRKGTHEIRRRECRT